MKKLKCFFERAFVINIIFMSTLLTESRIADLGEAASAIDSLFQKRALDFGGKIFINDVTVMKDPETIFSMFLSVPLISSLYLTQIPGDLYNVPSSFIYQKLNASANTLHYLKYNNIFMGGSLKITNLSTDQYNIGTMKNLYSKLHLLDQATSDVVLTPFGVQDYSSVDTEAYLKEYPLDSFLKRYDEKNVVLLLPGGVNSSVAYFMMQQTKEFFFNASPYIQKISLSLNFFNPISEIYIEESLNFVRTMQGIISFEQSLKGGFPLMYSSHQFDSSYSKFYFGVKIAMFIWTICFFLYDFFTVWGYLILDKTS